MRVIIAGAGEVGFHLAKLLANEKHDIVLIDIDQEKLKTASNQLDVVTVKGYSISYKALQDSNVSDSDLFIAVTSSEETNIATAIIAKQLGAKKTIARVNNVEFISTRQQFDIKKLGIDEIISPETLASREIKRLLKEIVLTDSIDFDNGKLSLIGITLDERSILIGKSQAETSHLNPNNDFLTVSILREQKTLIPRGSTVFELGDHVYFIAEPEGLERVLNLSGKKRIEVKNVMILGGGKIGQNAARKLSSIYNVKLIEENRDKCIELAGQLDDVLVLNTDGRNFDELKSEGVGDTDAFIAVTGNSEMNIISCLMAKQHGAKKTICLVENMNYIHLSQMIGVDTMINKKLLAANFIFRYIRQGTVVTFKSIPGVDVEILEFEIKENSKITSAPLKDLNFPKSAIV
ncbi:MAG: Trk system potassium transporter TrkA, partial [Leptospiraceae bacterium]|nr:Trk system potassium transporter TrkA [Leptospiraceae bacterium]